MPKVLRSGLLLLAATLAIAAHADPAPFDLAGPSLEVRVTRGARPCRSPEVPNLCRRPVWIKSDLPATQSAHYLLVAAFLRGSTNPPPASWFFRCKTWERHCAQEGLTVTVRKDAQQVLVFLAPETGGDFKTLVNAVRGRPGAFVRASQDLNQAALDRSRLENYLSAIRALDADRSGPAEGVSSTAGAQPRHQGRCEVSGQDSRAAGSLPDAGPGVAHSQRRTQHFHRRGTHSRSRQRSGNGGELYAAARYGYYSPYIASVLDIARIMGSFTTAQYQYIPALASQHGDQLALTLNTPPSFHDPKSVLVAALPAVEQPQLPPLHAVNPERHLLRQEDRAGPARRRRAAGVLHRLCT